MSDTKVAVLLGDPRLPYAYAVGGVFGDEELAAVEQLRKALARLRGYRFTFLDDHEAWIDVLRADPPDLALNFCDTGFRNDWELERDVPALLEILGIPYTGADPMSISLTTDKALVGAVAARQGIPVPNETYVDLMAAPLVLPTVYPCLIKPNGSGGSFGITRDCVVRNAGEAEAYLRWLAEQPGVVDALIQDFLTGPEYTLGLMGNIASGLTVLPPLEIDYSALDPDLPPILTHGSKADPDSPYWEKLGFRRADLDEITRSQLVEYAVRLFRRLGLRDYARIDFREGEDGQPRLLDVNTNPTWYWDGKLALMAQWAGHPYHELLRLILEAAIARCGLRAPT
ncbi:D-alanine--D-alanine ligase [Billgrantia azerbaijanica]|nr:D-alanine--D-alanine ligase [Halomonas azerbaijanica]